LSENLDETSCFQDLLGYRLTQWRDGFARIEQDLLAHLGNRSGIPHGGVYATMLDTAMGYTGVWAPEGQPRVYALTLSLTVNFVAQPKGKRLICDANLTGGGRTTFFTEAKLYDDLGTLVATGSGAFRRRG
jgi:uncharacterized protein (TIGR00369 family)